MCYGQPSANQRSLAQPMWLEPSTNNRRTTTLGLVHTTKVRPPTSLQAIHKELHLAKCRHHSWWHGNCTRSNDHLRLTGYNQHGEARQCSMMTCMSCNLKEIEGGRKTVVVESYVVDVPEGNSSDDTCTFVETIIGCNLRSLANVLEKLMVADHDL
ncbi:hypothetical protein Dsin_011374 [Dipteronia sinensis]|uniref:Uncharacterized protein n=1 Tax=Dipteronia sinensis TaxID=43782 RepID=A0AAE0EDR3_9ROSI|nr:hypothetical protein Dsin_011374 [Dipteronia sinensis]